MEKQKSWLKLDKIEITKDISIRIPKVGDVLDNERSYYNLVSSLTASPYSYMVQLDDMGIDYTKINEWELFIIMFMNLSKQVEFIKVKIDSLKKQKTKVTYPSGEFDDYDKQILILEQSLTDLSIDNVFCNLQVDGFDVITDESIGEEILYNKNTDVIIDRLVYANIADTLRKINLFEHVKSKAGNEHAKGYFLDKERKKQKRNAKKPYEPYLEKLVIALVNTSEFPYDYESCMELSMYQFNQSYKQIQHKIAFDKTMIGVYAGTIDTFKMNNKDCLSWIQSK